VIGTARNLSRGIEGPAERRRRLALPKVLRSGAQSLRAGAQKV